MSNISHFNCVKSISIDLSGYKPVLFLSINLNNKGKVNCMSYFCSNRSFVSIGGGFVEFLWINSMVTSVLIYYYLSNKSITIGDF